MLGSHRPHRHRHHRSRRPHHDPDTTTTLIEDDPARAAAASTFLSSIPMCVDPAVPPPPIFPTNIDFRTAAEMMARVTGVAEKKAWEAMAIQVGQTFLANVNVGPIAADQPPPMLMHMNAMAPMPTPTQIGKGATQAVKPAISVPPSLDAAQRMQSFLPSLSSFHHQRSATTADSQLSTLPSPLSPADANFMRDECQRIYDRLLANPDEYATLLRHVQHCAAVPYAEMEVQFKAMQQAGVSVPPGFLPYLSRPLPSALQGQRICPRLNRSEGGGCFMRMGEQTQCPDVCVCALCGESDHGAFDRSYPHPHVTPVEATASSMWTCSVMRRYRGEIEKLSLEMGCSTQVAMEMIDRVVEWKRAEALTRTQVQPMTTVPQTATPPLVNGLAPSQQRTPSPALVNLDSLSALDAHLFAHPLLFPSGLSAPLPADLTRSTTEHPEQLQPPLMPRAISEYAHSQTALMPPGARPQTYVPGSGMAPFVTPALSQQASEERRIAEQQPQQQTSADENKQVERDVSAPSESLAALKGAASYAPGELLLPGQQVVGGAISAITLSSKPRPYQTYDEWEQELLAQGMTQGRIRYTTAVHTSPRRTDIPKSKRSGSLAAGLANGVTSTSPALRAGAAGSGHPFFMSSLSPYVPRDHTSTTTTPSTHTPRPGGKSRSASFSIDAAHMQMVGREGGAVERGRLRPLVNLEAAGNNHLLALGMAAAAYAMAQEEAESPSDESIFGRRQGTSYAYLLPAARKRLQLKRPTLMEGISTGTDASAHSFASAVSSIASHPDLGSFDPATTDSNDLYDPHYLDDPNLKSGKHRVVLNLPGFMSSLVSYVRVKELKSELNETFFARHVGWGLNPNMSLSKIRKCKHLALNVGMELDLEVSTVALAYIYFDKLVLRGVVEKSNRKVQMAVALLLAYKWNEGTTALVRKKRMHDFFHACEKAFHVSRSAVLKAEFPAYVELDFNLGVKTDHVLHHFRRCLAQLDTLPIGYRNIDWSM